MREAGPRSRAKPDLVARLAVTVVGTTALALVASVPYGLLVALGGALFTAGVEYRSITVPSGGVGGRIASGLGTWAAGAGTLLAARHPMALAGLGAMALAGILVLVSERRPFEQRPVGRAGFAGPLRAVVGPLYFGALPSFLLLLPEGGGSRQAWLWFVLAIAWGGDIGGYLVGRRWGRRPLAPSISPAKSVEGALGSLALGSVLGLAVWKAASLGPSLATALWLAPASQVLAQAGDLLESRLKRRCGVKDSGRILGAGGGMLDCLDGLCLAAPFVVLASGTPA
ncbi:MAG: phosphatidate cytidylyltransferase [Bacteroidota bacterium]